MTTCVFGSTFSKMPEFQDITSLALLAGVLYMGERWATKLLDLLKDHLERAASRDDNVLAVLLTI